MLQRKVKYWGGGWRGGSLCRRKTMDFGDTISPLHTGSSMLPISYLLFPGMLLCICLVFSVGIKYRLKYALDHQVEPFLPDLHSWTYILVFSACNFPNDKYKLLTLNVSPLVFGWIKEFSACLLSKHEGIRKEDG